MELLLAGSGSLAVIMLVLATRLGAPDQRVRGRVASLQAPTEFGLPSTVVGAASSHRRAHLATGLLRVCPPLTHEAASLLDRAGGGMSVGRFLGSWVIASTLTIVATLAWFSAAGPVTTTVTLSVFAAAALVIAAPWLLLRRRAAARTRSINRALPQALDIIVTNIECGLGLQAAMLVIAEKFSGPIAMEFARVMREISLGVPREEALLTMAHRTGSPDVGSIARAIAQAERSGVSVGEILRARSRELRERRRMFAREQANKVPVKMTIPMVLFIFPTFFLLLLGPVAMNVVDVMGQ